MIYLTTSSPPRSDKNRMHSGSVGLTITAKQLHSTSKSARPMTSARARASSFSWSSAVGSQIQHWVRIFLVGCSFFILGCIGKYWVILFSMGFSKKDNREGGIRDRFSRSNFHRKWGWPRRGSAWRALRVPCTWVPRNLYTAAPRGDYLATHGTIRWGWVTGYGPISCPGCDLPVADFPLVSSPIFQPVSISWIAQQSLSSRDFQWFPWISWVMALRQNFSELFFIATSWLRLNNRLLAGPSVHICRKLSFWPTCDLERGLGTIFLS